MKSLVLRIGSIALFMLAVVHFSFGQYKFTTTHDCQCTSVKNQNKTGTCWSFSTISFLESELIRMGQEPVDISEMFIVRTIYKDKAQNYLLRQGKANFSQGSLAHDVLRAYDMAGTVPETNYSGKKGKQHDHSEMEAGLKGYLDGIMKSKKLSSTWDVAFETIMDAYMGEVPEEISVGSKNMTPKEYGTHLGINADDYLSFTSFTHHPFYEDFILEIPDNYSNGSFYNIPFEELGLIASNAIEQGYSLAWDGDVSEKGFSAKKGLAVLPLNEDREDLFDQPGPELQVTQANRQANFMTYSTTDDHLMHLTGIAKEADGRTYYIIKNSWGEIGKYQGYLYMSEAYFNMKTMAITVHKDAVPQSILKKLSL